MKFYRLVQLPYLESFHLVKVPTSCMEERNLGSVGCNDLLNTLELRQLAQMTHKFSGQLSTIQRLDLVRRLSILRL